MYVKCEEFEFINGQLRLECDNEDCESLYVASDKIELLYLAEKIKEYFKED